MQTSPYTRPTQAPLDPKTLVAPAGALLAFLGFFMPWVAVSIFVVGANVAGYQMGLLAWPVPLLCLAIIAAAFLPRLTGQQQLPTRIVIAACAAAGLLLVFFRIVLTFFEMRNSWGARYSFQMGLMLTILGLAVAFVGAFLSPAPPSRA
ncbi:MAG TPA: hypothetical protein VGV59_07135 [Pyrinomonadaceae bacterium]|nr:hypothetical protein [Pyrinomonadaceae bacterium]